MKKHIVCFGDSNTHGYCADPNDTAGHTDRFNEDERWTCLLQEAGPALVLGEAVGVVGGIVGVCAVAMGVGIAKADNVFFHVRDLLTS